MQFAHQTDFIIDLVDNGNCIFSKFAKYKSSPFCRIDFADRFCHPDTMFISIRLVRGKKQFEAIAEQRISRETNFSSRAVLSCAERNLFP